MSKVVAGAGAAATTAVVGSSFGADGTLVGAAVGSVVSAVSTAAYERSLDRTRQVVVAKVRPGGRTAEITQVIDVDATQVIPAQRAAAASVAPIPPPRRTRLPMLAGATAVIFLLGMLGVTGVELLAGGPVLSAQRGTGTSVGTVLGQAGGGPSTAATTPAMSSESATASPSPTSTSAKSEREARRSASPFADSSADPSTTPAPTRPATPAPTAPANSDR